MPLLRNAHLRDVVTFSALEGAVSRGSPRTLCVSASTVTLVSLHSLNTMAATRLESAEQEGRLVRTSVIIGRTISCSCCVGVDVAEYVERLWPVFIHHFPQDAAERCLRGTEELWMTFVAHGILRNLNRQFVDSIIIGVDVTCGEKFEGTLATVRCLLCVLAGQSFGTEHFTMLHQRAFAEHMAPTGIVAADSIRERTKEFEES